jgi:hypothetical protein
MKKSFNTLIFESINIMPVKNEYYISVKAELNVCITFKCPETDKIFKRFSLKSEAIKLSDIEAIKECIENLFNEEDYKRLQKHMDTYNVKINCMAHAGIDSIQIELCEPFKQLIKDLLNNSKWKNIKNALN